MIWILIIIGLISFILDISLKKKIKAIDEAIKMLPKDFEVPKNPLKTVYVINSIVMYAVLGLLVYQQFLA